MVGPRSTVGSLVLSLTLLAGLPPAASAAPAPTAPAPTAAGAVPRLAWGSCGADLPQFQCATATVPLDYDRPRGAKITLALTRLPATNRAARIGTLFVNPGGPGGSGVDFVQQASALIPAPVRARFDVLGFDPRGVARSTPATCFPTEAQETAFFARAQIFPVTAAEERRYTAESRALGRSCAATSPRRLAHMSTANVARDLDLLRRAVGDRKLSYLGLSYGTYLGATYARLFPDRVRALVLDGTIDPREWSGRRDAGLPLVARVDQGQGGSEVFGEFLRRCRAAGPTRCSLARLGDPATVARGVLARLKVAPSTVPTPDGPVTVTYQLLVAQTFLALYDPAGWAELADAYAGLAAGQLPAAGRSLAALQSRQDRPGREDYASIGSSLGTVCADAPARPARIYPGAADRQDARYPDFGRFRTWIDLPCRFVQSAGVRDRDAYLGPWRQTTRTPVLVLGTRWDPATPYANTRPYARLFPRASVVTLEGWGHVAVGQSRCAAGAAAAYLLQPRTRRADRTCAPDVVPFSPTAAAQTAPRQAFAPVLGGR